MTVARPLTGVIPVTISEQYPAAVVRFDGSAGIPYRCSQRVFVAVQICRRTESFQQTVLIHITNSKELIMRREFMVPFAWALTLGGMICISAEKKSGDRKPGATPVAVAVNSSSCGPRDVDAGVGDTVIRANKARTKCAAKPDGDGKTLEAGEFECKCKVHVGDMHSQLLSSSSRQTQSPHRP